MTGLVIPGIVGAKTNNGNGMRQKIVAGNWKMNGSKQSVIELLELLKQGMELPKETQCIVFPPAIHLDITQQRISDSNIQWGLQNCYPQASGAFTGEVSVEMAKDYGVTHCLVGHSERREIFGESEEFIAQKFHHAKENGIIPILCVGETLAQREQDETEAVIERQLTPVLAMGSIDKAIIAYEPVWAIGTGQTATPEQAQQVHAFIREYLIRHCGELAQTISLLYGGSVNEGNAQQLFAMPDIDGGLVGGASLNADKFVEIVKCIK